MLNPQFAQTRSYARIVNRLGWAMVIFFTVFQTFQVVVQLVFDDVANGAGSTGKVIAYGILSPLAYLLPFFIAGACFFLFAQKEDTSKPYYQVRLPALFPLFILAGLCINTAAAYINSLFCSVFGYEIPDELLGGRYDNAGTVISYMATALAPAFAEEFMFRGVIYTNLRPHGRTQAILLSSLAFALFHQNIGQLFYTFVCGIVLALMYEYTRSIWCSIFFHMFNNEIAIITDVLYNGIFGESILPYLQLWDVFVFAVGVVSIIVLILYAHKQKPERIGAGGYFGHRSTVAEAQDSPLSLTKALRAAVTPGALTFAVLSIVEMISLYFLILSY